MVCLSIFGNMPMRRLWLYLTEQATQKNVLPLHMVKKTSTFDYEILVRYMLPKGILDTFEVTKVEEECTGVMDETNTEIRILHFSPDSLVTECMKSISFNTAIVNNHGPEYTDMVYGECLIMCAAFYSPDITCLVDMQTPDHCAGIFNYGTSYNDQSWWSYLFLKRKKGYEAICLGDYVAVRSIFQLEDDQKRKYYLCSDNNSPFEFNQWLYWVKGEDEICRVAECHDAPMDGDVESYYFDKNRQIWRYAKWDEAKLQLIATSDSPAMVLHLDGKNSRFD